jgi:REP element-mobilizing transposase RayT
MANTYVALHYHIVFSTKDREPWIGMEIEERIWAYLGGVASQHGMTPLKIGGLEDHLHIVLGLPPTLAVSRAVQLLKGASSRWIRSTMPELAAFRWQDGYGVFSVSRSRLTATIGYVERQRERHRTVGFEEEFLTLLDRHTIAYDERRVWG